MSENGNWDLVFLCKPSFENAARQELFSICPSVVSKLVTKDGSGYLTASCANSGLNSIKDMLSRTKLELSPSKGPIFVTDLFWGKKVKFPEDTKDRLTPIVEAFSKLTNSKTEKPSDIRVMAPEQSAVPGLEKFCKKFQTVTRNKIKTHSKSKFDLIVFFESYDTAVVSVREKGLSEFTARRGRVSRQSTAPSRSGSKLTEAFRFFDIPLPQKSCWAVDLGAAPGGWSGVLVDIGFQVMAIDNGELDEELMKSGRVRHEKTDAFSFKPDKTVQMMVCDVVDQPSKIVKLVTKWIEKRLAQQFVFNLKLPMKKQYQEVHEALNELIPVIEKRYLQYRIDAHHLYHDRHEVTVWIELIQKRPRK